MNVSDFETRLNESTKWDIGVAINRTNPVPLDSHSVFTSETDLDDYVDNSLIAYPGQIVSLIQTGSTKNYTLYADSAGTLHKQTIAASSGGTSSDVVFTIPTGYSATFTTDNLGDNSVILIHKDSSASAYATIDGNTYSTGDFIYLTSFADGSVSFRTGAGAEYSGTPTMATLYITAISGYVVAVAKRDITMATDTISIVMLASESLACGENVLVMEDLGDTAA